MLCRRLQSFFITSPRALFKGREGKQVYCCCPTRISDFFRPRPRPDIVLFFNLVFLFLLSIRPTSETFPCWTLHGHSLIFNSVADGRHEQCSTEGISPVEALRGAQMSVLFWSRLILWENCWTFRVRSFRRLEGGFHFISKAFLAGKFP